MQKGSARARPRQFARALLRTAPRQAAWALALGLGLGACSGDPSTEQGTLGFVEGFLGGVVADEPRAALVGRDVLSAGGSAADAATAMYFTLSVTMPSRAGLGGGGVCLAFDAQSGKTQVLDFTARALPGSHQGADRPAALPANPRGFYALQARHGNLQWREVVAPAEQLARFGHPVSRAFAADLKAIGPALMTDAGARRMFSNAKGETAGEGDVVKIPDLAATLGMIRARGVGPFYTDAFARNLLGAIRQAGGGTYTIEQMRAYTPTWRESLRVEVGNEVAHFAHPPAAASLLAGELFAMLQEQGDFEDADEAQKATILADMAVRAFADRATWLNDQGLSTRAPAEILAPDHIEDMVDGFDPDRRTPPGRWAAKFRNRHETPSSTVFSAVDGAANAVSCAVTMNAAFGTGRVAPATGILLAAAPDLDGRGPIGLAPMIVTNENSKDFHFAGGASGGVAAPTALAQVAARVLLGGEGLKFAIARPRVHASGAPDIAYFEPELPTAAQTALSQAGFRTAATPAIGRVNAIACPEGLLDEPSLCAMGNDPRGFGLSAGSMK